MTTKNSRPWIDPPRLPTTHYIDNRIFTDPEIFAAEQARIFAGNWKLVCHESEMPNPGDFRVSNVAGRSLVSVRGKDGGIRSFYNVCPHRGAELVREPRGNISRGFQCFYHHWTFDLEGQCTGLTRPAAYERFGPKPEDVGLRHVRTQLVHGLVFISLNDDVPSAETYLGGLMPILKEHLGAEELEVFHHHSAVIKSNWKLWNDNNAELYHVFLHVFNRKTSLNQPDFYKARWHMFENGHAYLEQRSVNYKKGGLDGRDQNLLPGMKPAGSLVVGIFPDVMVNIRATAMRIDTITPLSPGETLVEWRGLGLKSDSDEVRAMRIQHHNQVWGPAGKNLAEDIEAIETQWRNMAHGASRYSIIAREEDMQAQCDSSLRSFYQEWGRRVGRWPHDADAQRELSIVTDGGQRVHG